MDLKGSTQELSNRGIIGATLQMKKQSDLPTLWS